MYRSPWSSFVSKIRENKLSDLFFHISKSFEMIYCSELRGVFQRGFWRPQRQLADGLHSGGWWQRWVLRRALKAEKAGVVWTFVKEILSKVRDSVEDSMKLVTILRLLQRERGSSQRICFGGINDLVNSDLPVVTKTSANSSFLSVFRRVAGKPCKFQVAKSPICVPEII